MNYSAIYDNLILKAKNREIDEKILIEKHHIIPRSFFKNSGNNKNICLGTFEGDPDHTDNLVILTLREHYLAHLLLYKINRHDRIKAGQMISALRLMSASKRYNISSRQYEYLRGQWMINHPCKEKSVQNSIRITQREHRLAEGYRSIFCACGCGTELRVTCVPDDGSKEYTKEHRPRDKCRCGCGNYIEETDGRVYFADHAQIKIKCACGCGKDTYRSYDYRFPELEGSIYVNGHNKETVKKAAEALKVTLNNMSDEDMKNRMKKSVLTCDQVERGKAIQRGKASQFRLTKINGEIVDFWSYDDVLSIVGISYDKLKNRMKSNDGLLEDGNKVEYLQRYAGNDWAIGTKRARNNSIGVGSLPL